MKDKKFDVHVHHIMAICGGFLGTYAILARFSIFGSAQTANLIEVCKALLGKNFIEVLIRLGALGIYITSIVIATIVEKKMKGNVKIVTLILECAVIFVLGFFPENMNPMIALYPIFFITAFQWCIFKGAKGYVSATIFSTNNVKQTVVSLVEYCMLEREKEEERSEKWEKAKFFGGSLLGFHLGVCIGYVCYQFFGIHSIWCCMIPMVGNMILLWIQEKQEKVLYQSPLSAASISGK